MAHVRLTEACAIAGRHAEAGELVEVSERDAATIMGALRGVREGEPVRRSRRQKAEPDSGQGGGQGNDGDGQGGGE